MIWLLNSKTGSILFRSHLLLFAKFTIKGCVNVKVFSVKRGYGINLVIEITDTGIGMSRADIARVSNGLYQANKQRTRSTGGIGIGLPIVYGFAHAMGGFVVIDSKKRSGTTVRVSIPQGVVDPSPCLELEDKGQKGLVFFIKPDKYEVPEMRDFVRAMAANLATGLNVKLYFVSEIRELEGVISNVEISHIFTGREGGSSSLTKKFTASMQDLAASSQMRTGAGGSRCGTRKQSTMTFTTQYPATLMI